MIGILIIATTIKIETNTIFILRITFHLTPIIPLLNNYYIGSLICILLVLIIMIQNPKGGGLSATFGGGGGSQMMGVQKTTDFLDKGTWILAITLLLLTLLSNFAVIDILPQGPIEIFIDCILQVLINLDKFSTK